MDLLLSSGFLAFARHLGFLRALEAQGTVPDAVVGTSSGALVGALWVAGWPLDKIAAELSRQTPLAQVGWSWAPWRGLWTMEPVIRQLRQWLPEKIEALPRPFAVGVVTQNQHRLLTQGPLPEAVAASCAMPYVFQPVLVDGLACQDGGALDRLGVDAWRRWRPEKKGIAHWVERTAGKDSAADMSDLQVVRTPRSGAKFWSLGDFEGQQVEAQKCAIGALGPKDGGPLS